MGRIPCRIVSVRHAGVGFWARDMAFLLQRSMVSTYVPIEFLTANLTLRQARALLDVDVFALKINKYDGLPREPKYIPPSFTGSEPTPTTEFKDPKLYTGGCHCGAVTIALKTDGPLSNDAEGFLQCDCSICMRNGTILAYPSPSQVSVTNAESLTPYSFARKFQSHDFCPVCGIAIWLRKLDVSEERWAAEHPDYPYSDFLQKLPVNLRLFEGVEWDEIEIPNGNWSQRPPKYVCPE